MEEKRKILVVDDEPDALELLKTRLESYGYVVLPALNAAAALEQAKNKPDVILLDLLIPTEKEGLRVFLALKKEEFTRSVPVIFLTGKSGEGASLVKLGAHALLEKPYETKDLFKEIASALKIH